MMYHTTVPDIEVAVPLYISNYCDSDCKICGMRKSNDELIRGKVGMDIIEEQLKIIYDIEKISSILILTGEYKHGRVRDENLDMVIQTVNKAFDIGFERVSINIGALRYDEIEKIKYAIPNIRINDLGLSVFQETYDEEVYHYYFGNKSKDIPKSDYDFRLRALERWIERGFTRVNLGILLGLGPVEHDKNRLISHYNSLIKAGAEVEISLPRIRGSKFPYRNISDEEFKSIVKEIAQKCQKAKIIITTREKLDIIKELIPYIGIISPGTSDLAAYKLTGPLENNPKSSQFYIEKERPRPSWILSQISKEMGLKIKYYNP